MQRQDHHLVRTRTLKQGGRCWCGMPGGWLRPKLAGGGCGCGGDQAGNVVFCTGYGTFCTGPGTLRGAGQVARVSRGMQAQAMPTPNI